LTLIYSCITQLKAQGPSRTGEEDHPPAFELRKVDVRLPGKMNSNSHGARPVHLIITMIKWIRTSRRAEEDHPPAFELRRGAFSLEREFFIDSLLVRIHFIIVMFRWTGLAPWEFEFPFPGSLTSVFLGVLVTLRCRLSLRVTWGGGLRGGAS